MKSLVTDLPVVVRCRDLGTRSLAFLQAVWDQIGRDKLVIRASGLAYASLLAMVPLTVVVFALFTAFAAFADLRQKIQELVLGQFLPSGQEQVTEYLDTFVENSRDLGFVGFVVLIVTAVLLLDNIEWNFNEIWHVRRRRGLMSRVMAYTSTLVFGTVLIGLSVIISARIRTVLHLGPEVETSFLKGLGAWLFPLASSFLGFLLMFLIIPAAPVRVRSAAIGAAFSAVTWELGKNLFAASVGQSERYETVYGSLATIPIFLIWLYVTWILVLVGLEVAYTHQNLRLLSARHRLEAATVRGRLTLAVRIMALVAGRLDAGEAPPAEDDLAERFCRESGLVSTVADQLEAAGLIRRVDTESGGTGLVPTRSVDRIPVEEIVRAVWGLSSAEAVDEGEAADAAEALVRTYEAGGREALAGVTLRDLAEQARSTS